MSKRDVRSTDTSTLRDYLHVARRRKLLIATAVVLAPLVAVLISTRQQHLYRSAAQVLLTEQTIRDISGVPNPSMSQQPDRDANTQAAIANSNPEILNGTRRSLLVPGQTVADLQRICSASPELNANLLTFACTDTDPTLSRREADQYAVQYTHYRRRLDTAAIQLALHGIDDRIAELRGQRQVGSAEYAALRAKQEQLQTAAALQSQSVTLVRPAGAGTQVQPKPARDGLLGLALGIVLGIGLAFLREALDTRVRSTEEVGERLGLPLLARLPEPPRKLRSEDRLVMLEEPQGTAAEAFRMLRTNLEFANLERGAQTIMVTSGVEAEGKSTTVANLAIALARAGYRVALVDLDLRRPFLDRFFALGDRPGLTHVALGRVDLDEALASVPVTEVDGSVGNGAGRLEGVLEVLLAGPLPPDAGEFVGSRALTEILERLRERADIVLIDAPPLLRVNDAMALSAKVDALLVVSRLALARRPMLDELRRVLDTSPATKLGFVLTGAEADHGYYGYGDYAYGRKAAEREVTL